jgi:L-fuconolactonase
VIQHFGPQRVMAGSNWPVVLLSGSFAEVWHGIENLLTGLSAGERWAGVGGTAERVYRI